jgi:hypothetical protein
LAVPAVVRTSITFPAPPTLTGYGPRALATSDNVFSSPTSLKTLISSPSVICHFSHLHFNRTLCKRRHHSFIRAHTAIPSPMPFALVLTPPAPIVSTVFPSTHSLSLTFLVHHSLPFPSFTPKRLQHLYCITLDLPQHFHYSPAIISLPSCLPCPPHPQPSQPPPSHSNRRSNATGAPGRVISSPSAIQRPGHVHRPRRVPRSHGRMLRVHRMARTP